MEVTMTTVVESLPQTGRLEVDIKVTADVNFSAVAARQKVNSFVLSEISYMMHAGTPILVVGERISWRVPVILSLATKGDVGEMGVIDVDVETGQMHVTPQLLMEINSRAEAVATHSAPTAAK
jgi:ABC-type transport system involved in Fe-S cluster assembly fused permease/ATPase subunit